jgi:hypothetical protein
LLLRSWIKESSSCSCHVSEQLESSIKEKQQITTTTTNSSSEAQRQIKEQEQEQITTIVTTTIPSSLRNFFLGDKRTRRNNLR